MAKATRIVSKCISGDVVYTPASKNLSELYREMDFLGYAKAPKTFEQAAKLAKQDPELYEVR